MSRGFKITLGGIGAMVFVVVFVLPVWHANDGRRYAAARTRAELNCVAMASRAYCQEYDRWPTTFADFTNNPRRIIFLEIEPSGVIDGWKRPVLYRPFNVAYGYGSAQSLGKDGKPGGTGPDTDMEVRFNEENQGTIGIGSPIAEPNEP